MTADSATGEIQVPAAPTKQTEQPEQPEHAENAELPLADFISVLRDEIGLDVAEPDLARSLDDIPGWDSVHLLTLITRLELRLRRQLSLPDFLDAPSFAAIYDLVSQ